MAKNTIKEKNKEVNKAKLLKYLDNQLKAYPEPEEDIETMKDNCEDIDDIVIAQGNQAVRDIVEEIQMWVRNQK